MGGELELSAHYGHFTVKRCVDFVNGFERKFFNIW